MRIDPTVPVTPAPMTAKLQTGQPCMGAYQCMDSDYCDDLAQRGTLVCTPLPKIGETCTPAGSYCVKEGFCHTDNTCHALPTAGQPCGLLRGDPYWCAPMLFCDTSGSTPAICRPYPHTGDVCASARVACLDPGTSCACSTPGCTTKHCLTVAAPGQPCGDPATTTCQPGTECRSSLCTPVDSQGLFAQACMH